jgi:hypothetical protein
MRVKWWLAVTQGLKKQFKDTQWTVEKLFQSSFVVGHKSDLKSFNNHLKNSVWSTLIGRIVSI